MSRYAFSALIFTVGFLELGAQPLAKQSDLGTYSIPYASQLNTIELEVVNSTHDAVKDVSVRLTTASPWVTFTERSIHVGALGTGETQPAIFSFDLDEKALVGETVDLVFDVESAIGVLNSHSIKIEAEAPTELMLRGNYPNPFNPTTKIAYALPKDANVQIEVFNTLGQRVTRILDQIQEAGYQEATWNASRFPSGLYLYSIQFSADADRQVKLGKMMFVK